MNKPKSQWGKAIVSVPWNRPDAWMNGIVLPLEYEIDGQYGSFFSTPVSMALNIVVIGPDIPETEDGLELPRLRVDAHSWQKVVVYRWDSQ